MRRAATFTLIFAFLLIPLARSAAAGSDEETMVLAGSRLYDIYCASCHGADGEGRGPMAASLKVAPTDLTRLSPDSELFPVDTIAEAIDGRRAVPTHGSREMPIWGLSFQSSGRESDQAEDVEAKLGELLAYLKSIQQD